MGCYRRETKGDCNHSQCPHPDATVHGYECIDIVADDKRFYCEVGDGCFAGCAYSFRPDSNEHEAAKAAFDKLYPEDTPGQPRDREGG